MIASFCDLAGNNCISFKWICTEITAGGRRQRVLYAASLKQLSQGFSVPQGIVLPFQVEDPNVAYDPLLAIKHVRFLNDEALASIPIVVACKTSEEEAAIDRMVDKSSIDFLSIGVDIAFDVISTDDLVFVEGNIKALDHFRQTQANIPDYAGGRHDLANQWGAYSLLMALNGIGVSKTDDCDFVRDQLFEDTYFIKKHALVYRNETIAQQPLLDALIEARTKYLNVLSLFNRSKQIDILVVEDQLDDGWYFAYRDYLSVGAQNINVIFVRDIQEARQEFNNNISLVLLDVRLATDRLAYPDELHQDQVVNLAGVEFAKWVRSRAASGGGTVPIIAATASNKVWTLELLLQYGINDYWIKASPESYLSIDDGIGNAIDLYERITRTLQWSIRTRIWVDSGYFIAGIIGTSSCSAASDKARSLHALLHQSFGPFSKTRDESLQTNLAYVLAISFRNEIIAWAYRTKTVGDDISYFVKFGGAEHTLLTKIPRKRGFRRFQLSTDSANQLDGKFFSYNQTTETFPDTVALAYLLSVTNLSHHITRYEELCETRNHLRQIHGIEFVGAGGTNVRDASEMDISDTISIYSELVVRLST